MASVHPLRGRRAIDRKRLRVVTSVRPLRIAGSFFGALAMLYLALASPLARQTEVSWAVPFGLLPIAVLIGFGALIQEFAGAGSVARRDGLFGLASALVSFAILRLSGAF